MLFEQIGKDYILAMKNKDRLKSATLSFLRAQMQNVMIDRKVALLVDADVIAVIKKQIKQRKDSIEQFEKGGRVELAVKETQELDILMAYLPPELSEERIREVVGEVIREMNAVGLKDMGPVMKKVIEELSGQADSKAVSAIVKQALTNL